MADKEISELTAADTLDGDEIVHISQGGNSRKATLLDIVGLSTGAMLTATYDPNADGIIAVAQGGTNSATAAGARTNLGLGTMAVQNAATVAITGGSVTGITDIAVADGGTGASDASGARTNLGLVIGTDVQAYSANLAGFAATTVANVQNRVNHTGTQLAATISDFSTAADLRISNAVGDSVQAYSALLDSVSDLSLTAGDIVYATGAEAVSVLGIGEAGQVLAVSDDGIPEWGTELVVGGLLAANDLSDVNDAETALSNIGGQPLSANLTAWSALATSAKQDASANLTTLSGVTLGAVGLDILEETAATKGAPANVLHYGTVDLTGSASSQTAVDAAVAAAVAGGYDIYWPKGTYLTTASIPNFHDVQHSGPGIVKRGSDNFYIWPKLAQTNNLYVATTGDDDNDGLTSSEPLATIQKACDIVAEYAPRLPGRWVINIAAGTYTENVLFDSRTDSEYPITIKGPTVASPSVPTAIIAAATTSTDVIGFDLGGHFILQYVKLQGATTAAGLSTNGAKVSGTNIHIATCLQGVEAQNQADVVFTGGIWTGRGTGVAGGVGYQGYFNTTHDLNGVTITAYERGGVFHEGVQGHLDNCTWNANGTGLNIKRGAGAMNTSGMTVSNNSVGILVENNAWYNNAITFTSNSVNVQTHGASPELVYLTVTNSARTPRQIVSTNFANHTGTTTETDVWTSTSVPAWVYGNAGHTHTVKIFGTCAATTAAITLRLKINNGTTTTTLGTLTLPIGSTSYYAEFTASYLSGAAWRTGSRAEVNGAHVSPGYTAATSGTVVATATTMRVSAQLGDVGDGILFGKLIWESTVGG